MVRTAYNLPGSSSVGRSAEERRGAAFSSPIRQIPYLPGIAFVIGVWIASIAQATPYDGMQSVDLNAIGKPTGIYATRSAERHDPAYWDAAKTSGVPATAATPLDLFGTAADIANAANGVNTQRGEIAPGAKGGVVNVMLTKSGLSAIHLADVGGATITELNIKALPGTTPTGLIIDTAGGHRNFSSGSLNLGPLATEQILVKFESEPTTRLSALTFDPTQLAALATVDFSNGAIDSALVPHNDPNPGPPRYLAFNDPIPITKTTGNSGDAKLVGTPEPSTIIMFGAGVIAIGILRMHRATRWRFGPVAG